MATCGASGPYTARSCLLARTRSGSSAPASFPSTQPSRSHRAPTSLRSPCGGRRHEKCPCAASLVHRRPSSRGTDRSPSARGRCRALPARGLSRRGSPARPRPRSPGRGAGPRRLPPGSYDVVVSAPGYFPTRLTVELLPGVETLIRVSLLPETAGLLYVTARPWGTLFVDGERVGYTSVAAHHVAPGI